MSALTPSSLNMPVSGEETGYAHMMACIYGSKDFHFLRRMLLRAVCKELSKLQPMRDDQFDQLIRGMNDGRKYIWVHQRGWSAPRASTVSPKQRRHRASVNNVERDVFGSPTCFDASGEPCWSPVPRTKAATRQFEGMPPCNNYRYREGAYTEFAGLYIVRSRCAVVGTGNKSPVRCRACLLYTSDAADE